MFETEEGYAYSVSATTRSPRPGEVDGVHYFFISKERFEEMIEKEELLEYASYVGNYYGTPKAYVEEKLEQGFDVILEIEVQGALLVKEKEPNAILIYMLPPGARPLYERLSGRGTETEEVIRKRMTRAAKEAEYLVKYDYIIVNHDIDERLPAAGMLQGVNHIFTVLFIASYTIKQRIDPHTAVGTDSV